MEKFDTKYHVSRWAINNIIDNMTNQEVVNCRQYCALNPGDSERRMRDSETIRAVLAELQARIAATKY